MTRPFRPCPDDFEETYVELKSIKKAMKKYRASARMVQRWIRAKGLRTYAQVEQKHKPVPPMFVVQAQQRTVADLKREFGAGYVTIMRFFNEAGLAKPKPGRRRRPMMPDGPRDALRHLRRFGEVFDGGEHYAAITGARYRFGRRRLDEQQMLKLARAYGWRG